MLIRRTAWHDLDHLDHAAVFVNEDMAVQHVRAREISKLASILKYPGMVSVHLAVVVSQVTYG
jgi:hypothetical protein